MHIIICLDESGRGAESAHFAVADLSFFERQIDCVTEEIDRLQARYCPDARSPIEFRASRLRAPEAHLAALPGTIPRKKRLDLLATEVA